MLHAPRLAILLLLIFATPSIAEDASKYLQDVESKSAPSTDPDSVDLCLARSTSKAGSLRTHVIYVDGIRSGSLRQDQYSVFKLTPGRHAVKIDCPFPCDMPDLVFEADYTAGRKYFFLDDPGFSADRSTWTFSSSLAQLEPAQAESLLKTLKLRSK